MPDPAAQLNPTTLIVEFDTDDACPIDFLGDSSDVVYFISMAHSERYGAFHPLARAAALLKRRLRVNISPLLKFADAEVEDEAEAQLLDKLWQDPQPLAASARAAASAIDSDPEVRELTADFPELPERLRELAAMAEWAAARGARVRLTYVL